MTKASISIFQKAIETEFCSQPEVPDAVFEAAKRVIENKNCELVKTSNGLYVVTYSENGPWTTTSDDEWLPVYVAKMTKWTSGGITKNEMNQYESSLIQ
jgi:hypothetical protein